MSTFSDISRSSRQSLTYNPKHWSVHNSIQHYNLSSGFIVRKRMKSQAQVSGTDVVILDIPGLLEATTARSRLDWHIFREQMSTFQMFRGYYKRPWNPSTKMKWILQGQDWIDTCFSRDYTTLCTTRANKEMSSAETSLSAMAESS